MTETLITEVPRRRRAIDLQTAIHNFGPLAILILLMLIAGTMSEVFFSTRNLFNVLRQVAGTGLMAVGMLFVILTWGIDLSVGSVGSVGSVAVALMIQSMAPGLAVGLTVLIGMGSGLVSGLLVAKLRLPFFVTTLAAMTIARAPCGSPLTGYRSAWGTRARRSPPSGQRPPSACPGRSG